MAVMMGLGEALWGVGNPGVRVAWKGPSFSAVSYGSCDQIRNYYYKLELGVVIR